ncbi:TrbI F-type domain-containing protein [Novosphingopyxis sp.]|uniref:TrbI F-type domain-containing protein n=1 Tax=Novosphingopyxis sp. TaxID=2709690 RepID=UPI003B58B9E3
MNKNKWATNLLATLKPALLMLVAVTLALWMAWVSRELNEPLKPQIVTVRLAQTMGAFVEREARAGGDGAASRLRTLAYLKAADGAVRDMGRDGRIVLVAEAVLAGDAPDATAELEARIAARIAAGTGAEQRP